MSFEADSDTWIMGLQCFGNEHIISRRAGQGTVRIRAVLGV